MKSFIALGVLALVVLCSGAPLAEQQAEVQARLNIYDDFLSGLFTGLVQTTFGSISGFLNQMISENPLNMGKRNLEEDFAARVSPWSFLYDNILQQFFTGVVNNTFNTLGNSLTGLIESNPLNLGKRDARLDMSILQFLNDNIFSNMFGGIMSNTADYLQNALNDLLNKPFGNGNQRAGIPNVNILQFLKDNIFSNMFSGIVSNTADYLQGALESVLNKPFGKRSADIEQAQALVAQTVSSLVQKYRVFAQQAVAFLKDQEKLGQLVQENIAFIRATLASLAQQLSELVPSAVTAEVGTILAALQSTLIYWTSGLGGSLGPVIGPFRP